MSSVSWKKLKAGEITAMVSHNARHDGKDVTYRNHYIDKSRTHLNYEIGGPGNRFNGHSIFEAQRLKERVSEIDAAEPPKRVRQDRVTAVAFCVAAPEALPEEKEKQFFRIAYKHIAELCGGRENVTVGFIHYDEIHDYIEPVTGELRTSRPHIHVIGIPYVPGTGVNGSKFETRANIRKLNNAIDIECRKVLGVPLMTGKYQPYKGISVEDLQAASISAAEKQAVQKMKDERGKLQKELDASKAALDKTKKEVSLLTEEKASVENELRQKSAEITEASQKADYAKQKAGLLEQEYKKLADRYNGLVRKFNLLLEKSRELGIAVNERLTQTGKEIER